MESVKPEPLESVLLAFLSKYPTHAERVHAVEEALKGGSRSFWRQELGKWATRMVPVEELVPEAYRHWRPLVRDSMEFVVSRLAPSRLAPKVVEQAEAPPDVPAEARLLRLIAKVPGLQKIGQVLARNRHFDPRFRRALSELENGISDVSAADICSIISTELGPRIKRYGVKMDSAILAEASVSAVLRFTWRNPANGRRERGVFKVLKPHIPACYAEDMKILQQLAGHLARKYVGDRSRFAGIAETLTEIRLLLRHEVDFRREQRTLGQAQRFYGSVPGVRVPRLIEPLSTASVTALTEENGVKVTDALKRRPGPRARLAERLVETLIAVPAFAREEEAIFHGDPHAGNLLYDKRRDELVILDWALKESLGRDQRRQLLRLVLMTILRDPGGISAAIEQLRLHLLVGDRTQARAVKESVNRFLRSLSLLHLPGPMDALHLLDSAAREGVRFPAPLVMFRKAAFTLDGVVEDVAGATVRMDSVLGRYVMRNSVDAAATLWSLLSARDWAALEWSALTLAARLPGQALSRYWTIPGTFGSLSFRQREA